MNIAILGFAGQGQSAYEYWSTPGNQLTICDQDEGLVVPKGAKTQLGKDYLKDLDRFDLLIRTPALHPKEIVVANPDHTDILDKVTTVTNEFMKVCPSKNIIGVTGTKGKGTTSTLITKILEAAGFTVHLGGNIGIPPLDMLKNNIQEDDYVVLELANFQLIDIHYSPKVGVCLMVVPEHLDWHQDMDEYVRAKQNLFRYQTTADWVIYNGLNEQSKQVVSVSKARSFGYEVPLVGRSPKDKSAAYVEGNKIYFAGSFICNIDEVALLGRHNLENVCAAISAVWDIVDHGTDVIRQAIAKFKGLEYRIEFIRQFEGVDYYNDSFATTPETSIACLRSFPDKNKIIILGGSDKGIAFDRLADEVAKAGVRHAIIIGDTGPVIEKLLRQRGFDQISSGFNDMASIVNEASARAKAGDVVLLSTGCASFGMFKDYKDRGAQFSQAVRALA